MSATTEKCGCKIDESRYLRMCEAHQKEHSELHERAMIDYRKTNPVTPG